LFALEINVDYGKSNKPYEILTLTNNFAFECKSLKQKVICIFDKTPKTPVFKDKTYFFKITPKFEKNL